MPKNIGYAKANARNAKVFNCIEFITSDFNDLKLTEKGAMIMINPPYGERIKVSPRPSKGGKLLSPLVEKRSLDELYSMIGERLKHKYPGNTAWILSASKELLNSIGLKPARSLNLYNGSLKCSFKEYELFAGKRNVL